MLAALAGVKLHPHPLRAFFTEYGVLLRRAVTVQNTAGYSVSSSVFFAASACWVFSPKHSRF